MRSCPPQYPRSSTPLNPAPTLFLFFLSFFSLPLFRSFSSFLSPLFFSSFLFLSFFPDPPSFFIFILVFPTFFFSSFYFFFVCVCACVCVSRMYVRAYLAIPCVSADDNVKHTKSNIRYDNKINKIKQM